MDFELSDSERQIMDETRAYAEDVVRPMAAQRDATETFDMALWQAARERNLVGIAIPKQYGGRGLGNIHLSILLEELNRVCASTGITISVHNSLLSSPIIRYGTEEQKQRWLPKLASGEWMGCYSLTEPGSGSDAAGLIAKAEKTPDGHHYVINGVKSWITSAEMAQVVLAMARTGEHKTRGISSFVITLDTPGARVSKSEQKSGLRGSKTNELTFTDCKIPADCLLGDEGAGFKIALSTLDGGRIGVAAQSVGIARGALEAAVDFLKKEQETGRVRRVHETMMNKIAEMKARLDASRLMVWRAAKLRDANKSCTMEAAAAKLFASQTATYCAAEAVQILGELGYTRQFEVERMFRDARITEIYEGTTEIQKLVIARSLLA